MSGNKHGFRLRKYHISGTAMTVVGLLWLIPIYYLVINAFKPLRDVVMRTADLPSSLYLNNFVEIWNGTDYVRLLINSILITGGSVILVVVLCSMAGYRLSRMRSGKWANLLILYFVLAMVVPFQAIMIPLVSLISSLGLGNSRIGMVLIYSALQAPMAIYLYYGAAKAIPSSLEESARIDGAGNLRIFYQVVFPLLKPMTSTVVILTALWVWNDFLLPLVLLSDPAVKTLPLGTTALFFGSFMNKWHLGITACLLASLPMMILYLVMQKHIVKGITAGAVKG